jgi:hypothetical protein
MTVKRKHGGNILRVSGGLAGDDPCCCEGSCLGYPDCLMGRTGTLVISGLISSPVLSVNCCLPYSHLGPPNTTTPVSITEQLTNANINGTYAMTNIGGGVFVWLEAGTTAPFSIEIANSVEDFAACGSTWEGASTVLTKAWLIQIQCSVTCSDNKFRLGSISLVGSLCRSTDNGATWHGTNTFTRCPSYNWDPVSYCSAPVATSTPGGCLFPCTASHTREVQQTFFTATRAGYCDYIAYYPCPTASDMTASLTIT